MKCIYGDSWGSIARHRKLFEIVVVARWKSDSKRCRGGDGDEITAK